MRVSMSVTTHVYRPKRVPRKGAVTVWLVVAGPVILLTFALAVQVCSLSHAQLELQVASDAAALAGADALVDDRLLAETEEAEEEVLEAARFETCHLAGFNHVRGKRLKLDPNLENHTHGQVLLGTLDNPFCRVIDDGIRPVPDLHHPHYNVVRVSGRHCGVAASATAFVDRDVLGFKIAGTIHVHGQTVPSIPVMPLALMCDPCPPDGNHPANWCKAHPASWEYQVMARKGEDEWSVDSRTGRVGKGEDGIPEFTVVLSRAGPEKRDNARLAAIGVDAFHDALRQFLTGLTADDLRERHGQLVLRDGDHEEPPTNKLRLPQLPVREHHLDDLASALQNIIGEPRVWMLYSGNPKPDPDEPLCIVGFVAARVVDVQIENLEDEKNRGKVGGSDGEKNNENDRAKERQADGRQTPDRIVVTLQPCMLNTATAITLCREDDEEKVRRRSDDNATAASQHGDHGDSSPTRRNWGPRTLFNPYVCKVRLTE